MPRQKLPYVRTREDIAAVARIGRIWKQYSDQMLWDLRDKFNDKYGAKDCLTDEMVKDLVLSYAHRWLWEDTHTLNGPEGVMSQFCNDALTINGRMIGPDNFDEYFDMKKFLDWKPSKEWIAKRQAMYAPRTARIEQLKLEYNLKKNRLTKKRKRAK